MPRSDQRWAPALSSEKLQAVRDFGVSRHTMRAVKNGTHAIWVQRKEGAKPTRLDIGSSLVCPYAA